MRVEIYLFRSGALHTRWEIEGDNAEGVSRGFAHRISEILEVLQEQHRGVVARTGKNATIYIAQLTGSVALCPRTYMTNLLTEWFHAALKQPLDENLCFLHLTQ